MESPIMSANIRVLINPLPLAGNQVYDLSHVMPFLPKCNPKVISMVQGCIGYTKDLFLKGLNSTMLSRIRPFEVSGKILTVVHSKNYSAPEAGSICYRVVGSRYQESAVSVWRDFLDVQNWNATGSAFLYQARVECGGKVCEKLYASGMIYNECEGVARNGTICNLPLLRKLCEFPQTVRQAVNETMQYARPIVVQAAKQETRLAQIFSSYVLPAIPLATGLAGAWALYKAFSSHQSGDSVAKTCALGLAGIAGLAATARMM